MDRVRTTLEMDGLYTQEDIDNRFCVMKPCVECLKFTQQDVRIADTPCQYCGGKIGIVSSYWYSLRTFKISKRLSLADKKKMGA